MENQEKRLATLEEQQTVLYDMLKDFDAVCKKNNIKYMLFAGTMIGAVRHHGFIPWDDDLDVILLREDYNKLLNVAEKDFDVNKYYLQKEFTEHWPMFFSKLRRNNTACLEKYHPKDLETHQGIYIDIFPCDNLSDNGVVAKLQFYAAKIVIAKSLYARGYETDSFKKKIFMNLCRMLPKKVFAKFVQNSNAVYTKRVHSFFGASSRFDKSNYKREYIQNTRECLFIDQNYPISEYCDELLTVLYGDYMKLPPESERTCKKHAILVDTENSWENYIHYRDEMVFDEFTRSIR